VDASEDLADYCAAYEGLALDRVSIPKPGERVDVSLEENIYQVCV
jgi:hypothetical protein